MILDNLISFFVNWGGSKKPVFSPTEPESIKVCFIGDKGSGKTIMIDQLMKVRITWRGAFSKTVVPETGVAVFDAKMEVDDELINVKIWDTPGGENSQDTNSEYVKKASIIFLTLDLTNPKALKHLRLWKDYIARHAPTAIIFVTPTKTNSDARCLYSESVELGFERTFSSQTNKIVRLLSQERDVDPINSKWPMCSMITPLEWGVKLVKHLPYLTSNTDVEIPEDVKLPRDFYRPKLF